MTLNNKITFYIPSTSDVSNEVAEFELTKRVNEVSKQFGQWFGGFTVNDAQGGWVTESGELVTETIKQVTSYATPEAIQEHGQAVHDLAEAKRAEWGQEAISVESVQVQGGLSFV